MLVSGRIGIPCIIVVYLGPIKKKCCVNLSELFTLWLESYEKLNFLMNKKNKKESVAQWVRALL